MRDENPLRWNLERLAIEELILRICLVALLAFTAILLVLLAFLIVL